LGGKGGWAQPKAVRGFEILVSKSERLDSRESRRLLGSAGGQTKNFWNSFQYDDVSEIRLLRDEGVLLPGLSFGVIGAFGLPGMLLAGWRFARNPLDCRGGVDAYVRSAAGFHH
jgi:hypothetical protein